MLPLLATQILWINLVTDGAPALALGVDPAERGRDGAPAAPAGRAGDHAADVARHRCSSAPIMAAGTLLVLDAALPGGLIEGSGDLRYAQTMAFTTLMFFQLFNVFNARSDERSAFRGLFANRWLWAAIALSLALQVLRALRAVAAAGLRHGGPRRGRLAALRRRGQLGALAAGAGQG